MRRLEMTCDICGFEERGPEREQKLGFGMAFVSPAKGWQTVPIKGKDSDCCPMCWNRILEAVAGKLPLEMKP